MNDKSLKEIIEKLKLESNYSYFDGAIQYFIDNQINVNELDQVLKANEFELPDEFFDLPKGKQKQYYQRYSTLIDLSSSTVEEIHSVIFNHHYFYTLADESKKNKKITQSLIDYSNQLRNIPLFVITMKNLKLVNIDYFSVFHSTLFDYAKNKKINNLFDLYMDKDNMSLSNAKVLDNYFVSKDSIDMDINEFYNSFCLKVEKVLYALNEKLANTIKLKFLVYQKDYLEDGDYLDTADSGSKLIKDYKSKFNNVDLMNLRNFVHKNEDAINSLPPNGYLAIYYCLMEVVHGY